MKLENLKIGQTLYSPRKDPRRGIEYRVSKVLEIDLVGRRVYIQSSLPPRWVSERRLKLEFRLKKKEESK